MTFDELWGRVCSTTNLPEGAKVHLPTSLSGRTKDVILNKKLSAGELNDIVLDAINTIDGGSILSVDDLVMKDVEERK